MLARQRCGFTLIEISIMLVIIGLLAGGILLGRDLISAAQIRATISQIEQYKTAVNTFKVKYGHLPGDIPAAEAAATGLIARAGGVGDGDGNSLIESIGGGTVAVLGGETVFFWTDLSSAGLLAGDYGDSSDTAVVCPAPCDFSRWLPAAKTGRNAYVYAGSMWAQNPTGSWEMRNVSFEIMTPEYTTGSGDVKMKPALTPAEAYSIDVKLDDGQPFSGYVMSGSAAWISLVGGGGVGPPGYCVDSGNPAKPYNVAETGVVCALLIHSRL